MVLISEDMRQQPLIVFIFYVIQVVPGGVKATPQYYAQYWRNVQQAYDPLYRGIFDLVPPMPIGEWRDKCKKECRKLGHDWYAYDENCYIHFNYCTMKKCYGRKPREGWPCFWPET